MKFSKHLISMFVISPFVFLSACTTETTSYDTSDGLLESNDVNDVHLTSSTKSSVLYPSMAPVPQGVINSNFPSSSYLGSNIISEQDILSIEVFKNQDLTRTAQVDDSGYIQFPLLSKVYAKGLTPAQLAQKIKQKLGKDYIVNPFVSVSIKDTNRNKFIIEGAIQKSGVYHVSSKTTILEAIARAGGLTGDADEHHATLLRRTSEGQIIQDTIDIAAIKRGKLQDFLLMQGDRIVIQKAIYNRVTISGAVAKPGVFPLTEGITVLQAITLAGGFNNLAYKDHVVLLRRNQTGKTFKKYSVNLKNIRSGYSVDPEIQPDDRIVVLESSQKVLLDEVTRILAPLNSINLLTR